MERMPKSGEIYRHFKNKLYQIVTVAKHSETGELLVIYQALYGDFGVYARPLEMFVSEVDHAKYPNVTQKYRFEKVELHEEAVSSERDAVSQPGAVAEQSTQQHAAENEQDEMAGINPKILEFLDTDDFDERYNILVSLQDEITDQMINTFAIALDVIIPEGKTEDRYDALKICLRTRQRYEGSRLR